MQRLDFLNSKGRREILEQLHRQYGFAQNIPGQLLLSGKEKLFLLEDSEFIRSGLDKELRIDKAGLKIGTLTAGGIRLNIEGSQILGPHCTQHVLELDHDHLEPLVKGEDIFLSERELKQTEGSSGLYILKCGGDFIGSGIVKNGKVWNQLSKNRRVKNFNS
jgi:NOL1/NOP2/fmu family ribosome biogenesis protein